MVKSLPSVQVMISRFVGSSPASGSALTAQSLEPALILCLPLSLPLSQLRSLSKINKYLKKPQILKFVVFCQKAIKGVFKLSWDLGNEVGDFFLKYSVVLVPSVQYSHSKIPHLPWYLSRQVQSLIPVTYLTHPPPRLHSACHSCLVFESHVRL